jgi:hypothetical protein
MKRILYLVAALVAGAFVAGAWASGPRTVKSVHLNAQNPATSFKVRIPRPHKIILYVDGVKATTSITCVKGTTVSTLSRSFHTSGTRNMLWHVHGKNFDVCHLSVTARVKSGNGYVSVDVYPR